MNRYEKKPLYRKVNTKARHVHHLHGDDYKNYRGRETAIGMRKGVKRGLDYTPLFRFLLSKVGQNWDAVHSEAVSRLDKQEPIYYMVSLNKEGAKDYFVTSEATYFSGLYIDDDGILQCTNPDIDETFLKPYCPCCTHSFNGKVFEQKYESST